MIALNEYQIRRLTSGMGKVIVGSRYSEPLQSVKMLPLGNFTMSASGQSIVCPLRDSVASLVQSGSSETTVDPIRWNVARPQPVIHIRNSESSCTSPLTKNPAASSPAMNSAADTRRFSARHLLTRSLTVLKSFIGSSMNVILLSSGGN